MFFVLDKYVNDVETIQESIGLGMRWTGEQLEYKEEWKAEDETAERTENNITMEAVKSVANSIWPWLQFTSDEPGPNNNWRVAMLDVEVWKETGDKGEQLLMYSFFEKKV